MSEKKNRRELRRKRRRRNQLITYFVLFIMLAAAAVGCFVGIRAAAGAIQDKRSAREEAKQAAIEASRAEESLQAQAAVEELLELNHDETEEKAEEYTPEVALNELVKESVAGMTLEQKVAGLFFVSPEQLTGVTTAIQAGEGTKEALAKYPVGGLLYSKKNIQSEDQIREMLDNTKAYSGFPIFLGIEEEGGEVSPVADALGLTKAAAINSIGESQAAGAAYDEMQKIGNYLSSYGFNVDFAPVADAQIAADMTASAVEGLQAAGVSACLKYFPGQGDSDTAAMTNRSREEMEAAEFLPFASGIAAGTDFIMVGHINAPALTGGDNMPASLSSDIVTGILRRELGYDGIIITDAMNAAVITEYYEPDVAAIMALKSGADMVLIPDQFEQAYEGVLEAVKDGTISEERVNDSLKRIYRVKLRDRVGM